MHLGNLVLLPAWCFPGDEDSADATHGLMERIIYRWQDIFISVSRDMLHAWRRYYLAR